MTCVGYYHAIVLSPTAYARQLYPRNINEESNYWKHEDAARHMANQLMNKFPKVTVLGSPSPDSLPSDLWKDPVRITATLFCQASRVIVLIPSDCAEHIAYFSKNCLTPLLSKLRQDGGRPEWHSRFVAAAIGSVTTPTQLTSEIPFIKVVRFREIAWFRDISAMVLMEGAIKDFWVPTETPPSKDSSDQTEIERSRITRIYSPLVSKVGYSLDECVETTSVIGFSTHVTGKLDLPDDSLLQLANKSNATSPERHSSGRKSRSRSSTRSRSRILKPEFEAREAEQSELKTFIKGNVGEVVPKRLDKPFINGSSKPTQNGSDNKVTNGFHTPTLTAHYSTKVESRPEENRKNKLFEDKVKEFIDEIEKVPVEEPITESRAPVTRRLLNIITKESTESLQPKDKSPKSSTSPSDRISPRIFRSGKGILNQDLKAPLASASNDDEDIHVKQDTNKQQDTTDAAGVESPRKKAQTSYIKRVVTREQTYSTFTSSERIEGRRSPVSVAGPKTSPPLVVSHPVSTPTNVKSSPRPTTPKRTPSPTQTFTPSQTPVEHPTSHPHLLTPSKTPSPIPEEKVPTAVSAAPVKVVVQKPSPPPTDTVEEAPKRQPVRIITARRIYTDQKDAPVLRPATPPKTKQFTRTISVRNLSSSKPVAEESNSIPRSVSVFDLNTAPPSPPIVSPTPSTSTNTSHLDKPHSSELPKTSVENIAVQRCCDSHTQITGPLMSDKTFANGVECYADRGYPYPKLTQSSNSTSANFITKEACLWTGPDAGELYRLELLLNKDNVRIVRCSDYIKTPEPVQTIDKTDCTILEARPVDQVEPVTVEQGTPGPSANDLMRIMLIYVTAFLTVLLSIVIAYFLIVYWNCDSDSNHTTK